MQVNIRIICNNHDSSMKILNHTVCSPDASLHIRIIYIFFLHVQQGHIRCIHPSSFS